MNVYLLTSMYSYSWKQQYPNIGRAATKPHRLAEIEPTALIRPPSSLSCVYSFPSMIEAKIGAEMLNLGSI